MKPVLQSIGILSVGAIAVIVFAAPRPSSDSDPWAPRYGSLERLDGVYVDICEAAVRHSLELPHTDYAVAVFGLDEIDPLLRRLDGVRSGWWGDGGRTLVILGMTEPGEVVYVTVRYENPGGCSYDYVFKLERVGELWSVVDSHMALVACAG